MADTLLATLWQVEPFKSGKSYYTMKQTKDNAKKDKVISNLNVNGWIRVQAFMIGLFSIANIYL